MRALLILKQSKIFVALSRILTVVLAILVGVTGSIRAATPCETLVQTAYKKLDDLCSTVARNQACYGNDAIRTEFNLPYEASMFSKGGDKAPITAIREIYTLPMDMVSNTWGLSLLKVQTSLPDTAPGQNVIFILYGDVHLSNADDEGKMAAFYFTSGLGELACKEAPTDGLIIRSPKGTRVQFNANGVNIDIGSTVVLQASPNKQLTVQLIEGSAKITADNKMVALIPGQSSSVPLGGIDGLQAVGTPTAPINNPISRAQQNLLNSVQHAMPAVSVLRTATPTSTNDYVPPATQQPKPTQSPKPPHPTYPPPPTHRPHPTYPPPPTHRPHPTHSPKH